MGLAVGIMCRTPISTNPERATVPLERKRDVNRGRSNLCNEGEISQLITWDNRWITLFYSSLLFCYSNCNDFILTNYTELEERPALWM